MAVIGKNAGYELGYRGISVSTPHFDDEGPAVEVTTTGLMWLLNTIHLAGRAGRPLALQTLKEASRLSHDAVGLRALRLTLSRLPTYENDVSLLLSVYLVGSPPRLLYHFAPTQGAPELSWPAGSNPVMTLRKGWVVNICLSPEEWGSLQAGDSILVKI